MEWEHRPHSLIRWANLCRAISLHGEYMCLLSLSSYTVVFAVHVSLYDICSITSLWSRHLHFIHWEPRLREVKGFTCPLLPLLYRWHGWKAMPCFLTTNQGTKYLEEHQVPSIRDKHPQREARLLTPGREIQVVNSLAHTSTPKQKLREASEDPRSEKQATRNTGTRTQGQIQKTWTGGVPKWPTQARGKPHKRTAIMPTLLQDGPRLVIPALSYRERQVGDLNISP